jgi:voltage-gated potassium channel
MNNSFSDFVKNNKTFNGFIIILIVLNVLSIMLESVESLQARYGVIIYWFNVISVLIFTVEYFMRIVAHRDHLIRYIFSFYARICSLNCVI